MPTLHVAIAEFLDSIEFERRLSSETVRAYRSDLIQWGEVLQKELQLPLSTPVGDLQRELWIASFRAWLAQLYPSHQRSSIARKAASLRVFTRFCRRRKWIEPFPMERLPVMKHSRQLPRFLGIDSMRLLVEQPLRDGRPGCPYVARDQAILEILYATGIRIHELATLELGGISVHSSPSGRIKDGNQSQIHDQQRWLKVKGKGGKPRMLPILGPAWNALERWLVCREALPGSRSTWIWLNRHGGALSMRSVARLISRHAMKLGLSEGISPHWFRQYDVQPPRLDRIC